MRTPIFSQSKFYLHKMANFENILTSPNLLWQGNSRGQELVVRGVEVKLMDDYTHFSMLKL